MRPTISISIDPDINDLGWPRERLVVPYPRQFEVFPLGWVGSITLPKHGMTEAEWAFLMGWLELSKPAFVKEPNHTPPRSRDASG